MFHSCQNGSPLLERFQNVSWLIESLRIFSELLADSRCQTCIARSITELMLNAVALNAILDVFWTLSVVEFASDVSTAARFVQVILWLSNIVNYKIAWCFQNRIKLKLEVHVPGMFVVIVIVWFYFTVLLKSIHTMSTSMFFKRDHQHFFFVHLQGRWVSLRWIHTNGNSYGNPEAGIDTSEVFHSTKQSRKLDALPASLEYTRRALPSVPLHLLSLL